MGPNQAVGPDSMRGSIPAEQPAVKVVEVEASKGDGVPLPSGGVELFGTEATPQDTILLQNIPGHGPTDWQTGQDHVQVSQIWGQ